jgi:hypothetical protein
MQIKTPPPIDNAQFYKYGFPVRFPLSLLLATGVCAAAQTNLTTVSNQTGSISALAQAPGRTNEMAPTMQRVEEVRATCIQTRRQVCGKILKILPEGLVVDSGYTNLDQPPLNRSWLQPGTVATGRAQSVVEGNQPDSMCIGLVFLTDLPKGRGPGNQAKPRLYDYVNLEAYPAGKYTYTSVGNVQRTVRKFSANLAKAIQWNLENPPK